jgi:hypothetical protein
VYRPLQPLQPANLAKIDVFDGLIFQQKTRRPWAFFGVYDFIIVATLGERQVRTYPR